MPGDAERMTRTGVTHEYLRIAGMAAISLILIGIVYNIFFNEVGLDMFAQWMDAIVGETAQIVGGMVDIPSFG